MKNTNQSLSVAAKKTLAGVVSASLLVSSVFMLTGCSNNGDVAKLEEKVSSLSTAAQMAEIEKKLEGLSSDADVSELKALIEQLADSATAADVEELKALIDQLPDAATAADVAELKTLINQISDTATAADIAELKTLINQFSDSATAADIAELKTLINQYSDAATSADVEELKALIGQLSSAEQIEELKQALFPAEDQGALAADYADEAYEKFVYIDKVLKDRDCLKGDKFKLAQKWIIFSLMEAGYKEGIDIVKQDTYMTQYAAKQESKKAYAEMYPAVDEVEVSKETYNKQGRKYVLAEGDTGAYVQLKLHTPNIIVTKEGKSDKTIIVGAHYDGNGSGDNGSSVALAVTTAQHLFDVETEYTIKFVFFTAEEYGLYGSKAYVNAMTEEEKENTLYMINMDSLVCGDYCYLYGGIQNDDTQTVAGTEAYDNAMAIANKAGLSFKSNPWTWEAPAPGYDAPDYASPSTGDWSDHAPFKNAGINYLYFEATNWEIPGPYAEYDGYGETYLVGMLMNTPNDYVEYIETYFPGRPQAHLKQFSTLLNLLLTQTNYGE